MSEFRAIVNWSLFHPLPDFPPHENIKRYFQSERSLFVTRDERSVRYGSSTPFSIRSFKKKRRRILVLTDLLPQLTVINSKNKNLCY